MLDVCTFCDKNYVLKGLNLYQSLLKNAGEEFRLYWLCLDEETFIRVGDMQLPGVILFRISDLGGEYGLENLKKLPDTQYGDDHANFCWRMTPIWIYHLMKFYMVDDAKLIYADSDIFFYHSPRIILDIIGAKSVGIHTHRFSRPYDDDTPVGWYNVGVMVFTNNDIGNSICRQWWTWVQDPETVLYKKYGTCGDQKWLNLFIPTFGPSNICVFDEEGDCGHLAPWNYSGITHPRKHYIIYKGRQQPVVFYHFSHFTIKNNQWRDSDHGEWNPASDPDILPYYHEYFAIMQSNTIPTT